MQIQEKIEINTNIQQCILNTMPRLIRTRIEFGLVYTQQGWNVKDIQIYKGVKVA